ncbi:MAG: WYL domain-containing protein [Actinobacteria bacterium]|nr:WYL domain-containing protein [Actinomycetota bacterium]
MSTRTTAADRYRRILAMVPWIAQQHAPTLEAVAEHFDITVKELMADLDVVLMVGIPPYLPGDFIDVSYESGHVDLRLGDLFTRPLQLTATEALTILTSSTALRAAEADDSGPIARALAKLQVALGVPDGSIEISLGEADSAILAALRSAVDDRRQIEIDYYSSNSDTMSTRRIDPTRLYATQGNWYVAGWCHRAEALRVFRVDRIQRAALTDATFEPPSDVPEAVAFASHEQMPRVAFDLEAATRVPWDVARPESVEELGDGRRRAVFAVGGDATLARLVLQLGDGAQVVEPSRLDGDHERMLGPADVAAIRDAVVQRIRARYDA